MRFQVIFCFLTLAAAAVAQPQPIREGDLEILYLDDLASPARWGPAECTVKVSDKRKALDHPTMHLHIPVDHHAGEKAYPIGWPRMYLDLKSPEETTWGQFERFEFMMYTEMSREVPPRGAINFQMHCPAKPHNMNRDLKEIKINEWVLVSIPIRDIARVKDIARLGINIAESDYEDGDILDFYFGAFRLVRSAEFGLSSMKILSRAIYRGQPRIKVELDVAGPPLKVHKGLPLTVQQGDRSLRIETLPVRPGVQILDIEIHELQLEPGEYRLIAFDQDPEKRLTCEFRIVDSPWEGE